MSRRIQCNTLSVKPKSDGTCGNIECETLSCKNIICDKMPQNNNQTKKIEIPYSLQIGHISLGMMGTSQNDCSHQIIYSPCPFKANKLTFIWHDRMPGYPEETVFYKVNDKWEKVVLKESQTTIKFDKVLKENDKIITSLYANVVDENESSASIQSLSVNLSGVYEINI